MAIPDYQRLMGPVLLAVSDGSEHRIGAVRDEVAQRLGVSADERSERIKSGAFLFDNRLNWAATYMAQAGLIRRPKRGVLQITERGREVLAKHGEKVSNSALSQFEEFREFRARARSTTPKRSTEAAETVDSNAHTPLEAIEAAVEEANAAIGSQLLERIIAREWVFLERLVLQVLTKMGYGGGESSQHLGRSGDGGVDGVIRQDALGLENIYLQAKRYDVNRAISRPEIQAFVGALHGQQADRGVFITTSRFTQEAREYAERVNARVILIDGEYLTRLMVRHNVGVEDQETFVVKRLDEDFFADE
jgi:restriction system protein